MATKAKGLREWPEEHEVVSLCRPGSHQEFGNLFWVPHSLAVKAVFFTVPSPKVRLC